MYLGYWSWNATDPGTSTLARGGAGDAAQRSAAHCTVQVSVSSAADAPGIWLVSDVVSLALRWRTQWNPWTRGGLACGESWSRLRRAILGCAAPNLIPWRSRGLHRGVIEACWQTFMCGGAQGVTMGHVALAAWDQNEHRESDREHEDALIRKSTLPTSSCICRVPDSDSR